MGFATVYHYDAFSSIPNSGNPAGVVLAADGLTDAEMQQIAKQVGFNETVFVHKSNIADLRLRYFTPGHEINLCGHATVAALFCMHKMELLKEQQSVRIETNVGVLPIRFIADGDRLQIEMRQDRPKFIPFTGSIERLADSIGLVVEDKRSAGMDGLL